MGSFLHRARHDLVSAAVLVGNHHSSKLMHDIDKIARQVDALRSAMEEELFRAYRQADSRQNYLLHYYYPGVRHKPPMQKDEPQCSCPTSDDLPRDTSPIFQ